MKVYWPAGRRNHSVFITPGNDSDACSDWFGPKGEVLSFTVNFIDGVAEVPGPLGKFMLENKVASKTMIIDAATSAQMYQEEERVVRHRVLS